MKNELLKILKKENADFLLLENCDSCAFLHNENTQLCKLTKFSGTAGEAVLSKDGSIFLFVDSRYHIQADFQSKKYATIIKVPMGETFMESIKTNVPRSAKLIVDCNISLSKFRKFEQYFEQIKPLELPKNPPKLPNALLYKVDLKRKFTNFSGVHFISNLEEIAYLTNLRGDDFDFSTQFVSKMIIKNNEPILYTDHKIPDCNIKIEPYLNYKKALCEQNEVYYCPQTITYCDFCLIKKPVVSRIKSKMPIKTKAEIEHLKSCFMRLDKALSAFKSQIKKGLSEVELKDILENEILSNGAKSLSFKTLLAIEENSASIHYSTYDKNRILSDGDLILLDCGGYYECGYATDITRVFVCGKPDALQKKVYTTVLKGFFRAYYSKEIKTNKLDLLVRNYFKKHAPKGFTFGHALGHGVGINVHQAPPTLSPNAKGSLKKGMVFTIEPGLYCENKFGIRLENSIYYDGEKHTFSHFEFEEKLIDFGMLTKQEKKWLKEWQND